MQTLGKVKGVMGDRRLSHKLKGKVLSSRVVWVYMNALETTALTEKQQVQVCEKQLRIIVRVERTENRRMDEMRV